MSAQGEKCLHFNSGYCKFTTACKFYHPSENCEENCKDKACLKRHPKNCNKGNKCSFFDKKTCAYKHTNVKSKEYSSMKLKEQVKRLSTKVDSLVDEIKTKDHEISDLKHKIDKLERKPVEQSNSALDVTVDETKLEENLKQINHTVQHLEQTVVDLQDKSEKNEHASKYN